MKLGADHKEQLERILGREILDAEGGSVPSPDHFNAMHLSDFGKFGERQRLLGVLYAWFLLADTNGLSVAKVYWSETVCPMVKVEESAGPMAEWRPRASSGRSPLGWVAAVVAVAWFVCSVLFLLNLPGH